MNLTSRTFGKSGSGRSMRTAVQFGAMAALLAFTGAVAAEEGAKPAASAPKGEVTSQTAVGKIITWPRIRGGAHAYVILQRADGRCMTQFFPADVEQKLNSWADVIVADCGSDHVLGLKADGTVIAAGENGNGQCDVDDWKDIVAVAAGRYHSLGLKSDGTVVGAAKGGVAPHYIKGVSDWKDIVAIGAGQNCSIGVKRDGACVLVGNEDLAEVRTWKDIVAVSAGHAHVLGLKKDGTVVSTAPMWIGQCDVQDWRNVIDIQCCHAQSVGLCADGSVVYAGRDDYRESESTAWKDVVAVGVSELNVYGVRSDGTVVYTAGKIGKTIGAVLDGWNAGAIAGNTSPRVPIGRDIRLPWPPKDWKPLAAEAAKPRPQLPPAPKVPAPQSNLQVGRPMINFTTYFLSRKHLAVGLKTDGTCLAYGDAFSSSIATKDWKDIVSISATDCHTLGLKVDGTAVSSPPGPSFKFGDVSSWKELVAVVAGYYHCVGLKADGTVVATGNNGYGRSNVGDWQGIVAIGAGANWTVGVRADGLCVATGKNNFSQCEVYDWKDIVAVSCGYGHTVGLKKDKTVVAVGRNDYGQCDVSGWKNIIDIYTFGDETVGLKSDGTVVFTGRANENPLGYFSKPVQTDRGKVQDWKGIVGITANRYGVIGLKSDGMCVYAGYDNPKMKTVVLGWDLGKADPKIPRVPRGRSMLLPWPEK